MESCAANGLGNESDEESAALSTPPASDSNPADRFPSAYSNKVESYPIQHEDDTEAEEAQPKFRLAKLTDLSEFQDALDEAEEGTKENHFRALQGVYQALVEYQDEWLDLDKVIKTSRYPNTISIEDELERDRGRVRGFIRDPIKPTQRVINPRAKPVRPDDPEKWYYTNQFQLDQDKTEAAVYGYIVKESARDIGHQDPIGQRPRGPGQNRDLRVRQPPRNTIGDGDSGDESGLNAVDDALMEGGRGKREKRPSNRVMGTNSRASSVDAKPVKQPRKNAKSRLAELEADPSAAENLDSTQRWADDVDAAGDRQPGDDSDSSEDEAGVAKPHKGPKSSYLDKPKKAAKKGKNAVDSINGELDDDEAEAAKKARSQKRSEGAKMGWAKRKEALAAKESSTQASINGDDDEGNRSELAKQEPNDGFDANSALKTAPKKKEKKMMQLADGTWIEKPSAATINMRRRWQKKREAEAKGLPPPKIGRYKKTDVPNASDTPTPANFDDAQNNEFLAAVDRANSKRKQASRDDSEQMEDDNQDEADKKGAKATTKRRKKNIELSDAMILDEDTVNDNTLELEDDDLDAQQSHTNKGKRGASSELGGPPNKRARNPESLASSDEDDEATEFEDLLDPSSSPKKRKTTKGGTKGTKKTKGTHKKKSQAPAVSFPNILRTTNRRTTPKLGSFVRRGSTAKPTGGGDEVQGDANDDELENQTTEDERPPLSRFDSRPSGFSFEVDDLPPGHPLLAQAPIDGGPTFGPSFMSGPLSALRNPPGPTSMGFGGTPSMGFFTPLEHLVPSANNPGSLRPMDPFLAPYTQSNPHPPVYSRTPSSDRVIPRPSRPGRNENVKPSEPSKKRASGSAGKSKAQALNLVDARDLELAGGEFKAPKPSENQDPGQRVRRSSRSRKAPVKREYVEPDSKDIDNVPSSPPKPRLPRKSTQSRPSNRSGSRPSRIRNFNGRFEKTGMDGGEQDEYDDEQDYYDALEYDDYMREHSQAAPASNRYELDEDSGARSPASGQTQGPVRAEVEQHPLPDEDEDDRDANLQIARGASLAARGEQDAPGVSANPGYGGTTIPGREGALGGADVALPSRPKKPSSGLWTGKNWVHLGEQKHHTLSQDFPELDSRGLPIGGAPVLGKRVRKPARPVEAAAPPGPATGGAKRSSKTQAGSKTRKSKDKCSNQVKSSSGVAWQQ